MSLKPLHVFSIDIEDWYQSSYDFDAQISDLCVRNTRTVLDFLSRYNVIGTFFVQGLVAKQYPSLIKEINAKGHEIQSHGFSHRPVYSMPPAEFKRELSETSRRIEDITGNNVTGFRAPDFSINENTFWAFEVMIECGISYDSSIFPSKTPRYGVNGFERGYSIIKTPSGIIDELPVNVLELKCYKNLRIPVSGGGYFRLFPSWFLKYAIKRIEDEDLSFIIYCHPYEFNPNEWKDIVNKIPIYRRLHQGIGRKGFSGKVAQLLQQNNFGTMSELLHNLRGMEKKVYISPSLSN